MAPLQSRSQAVLRFLRAKAGPSGIAVIAAGFSGPAIAQSFYSSGLEPSSVQRDTYGEVGLLDMPSGHMAGDGQFGANLGILNNYQRYAFWFQALPWLETSFRYSRVPFWAGERVYYDRSFSLKLRLMSEADGLADITLGTRDFLGTGVYSADYLTASRHIGPFDLTAGLGWGRLASVAFTENPLGYVSSSFQTRQAPTGTGTVDVKQFLHGKNVGLFGGVIWQSPIDGLSVIAEYSSDKYADERLNVGGLKVRSPVNVGLSYKPLDTFGLTAGWYYGTTYGLTLTLSADPITEYPSAVRVGPSVPPPVIRSPNEQQLALHALSMQHSASSRNAITTSPTEQSRLAALQALYASTRGIRDAEIRGKDLLIDASIADNDTAQCARYARIAAVTQLPLSNVAVTDLENPAGKVVVCQVSDGAERKLQPSLREGILAGSTPEFDRRFNTAMQKQSLQLDAMWINRSEVWVYYENYYYRDEAEAVGRIVRVLMAEAPSAVEIFHIVPVNLGVPQRQITIARSSIERSLSSSFFETRQPEGLAIHHAPMADPTFREQVSHLYPSFSWSLDPKLAEHLFDPDAPIQFMVYGDAAGLLQLAPGLMFSTELTGTIWSNYTFVRPADSALPHVRTDLLQYIKHGKYGISGMQLIYRSRLLPDVYTELRGGLLEDMFAGVGGQILWRPAQSRFAVGADFYQVWQREYHRLFSLQKYQTITGHVSAYYESPWYGLNLAAHFGRYLAGDRGATFELSRRFSSGIEIGAWVTFTNVSKQQFGEGSFDKGIIIHIPFEWGLPIHSQSSYDLHMNSLTRDGGQRLAGDDSLYDITRQDSYGEMIGHIGNVLEP